MATGIDCISKGYKDLLDSLISRDVAKNILMEVLAGMPVCEVIPTTLSQEGIKQVVAQRQKSPEWNIKVDYTDASGKLHSTTKDGRPFTPSALTKELGLKMSETQTLCDETKCRALDVVDIFRVQGYIVECEVEKEGKIESTLDCVKASAGGKAMHVFHPGIFETAGKKTKVKAAVEAI